MTTAALNSLWDHIQSMSLTKENKQWLAQKLVEPSSEMPCVFTEEEWQEELVLSEAEGVASDEEATKFFQKWGVEV